MGYLSSLVEQSGVQVGPRSAPRAAADDARALEVDDVRIAPPTPRIGPAGAEPASPAAPVQLDLTAPATAEPTAARERRGRVELPAAEPAAPAQGAPAVEVVGQAEPAASLPISAVRPAPASPTAAALEHAPALEPPWHAQPSPPAAEPTAAKPPIAATVVPPPEQVVLERVAEVVAWVSAGPVAVQEPPAPRDEPAAALETTVEIVQPQTLSAAPPAVTARPAAPEPAPAPRAGADVRELSVSVGTIELTLEEPAGAAAPAPAPPRAETAPSASGVSRLTRHYLRA